MRETNQVGHRAGWAGANVKVNGTRSGVEGKSQTWGIFVQERSEAVSKPPAQSARKGLPFGNGFGRGQ